MESEVEIFEILKQKVHGAELIGSSKHCAAVVHNGKIISIGFNQSKTHPLQREFQSKPERIHLHAEIDAIRKVKNKKLLSECEMYVLRESKGRVVRNSEPCDGCKKALKFFKFKNVFWTD